MNTSPLTRPRKVNQAGAILPVVLLLGMGLMIGVAGVVNLGFVQDDLARAERTAMDSSIATQYLTDFQQIQNSREGVPNGARIPFPAGGIFFASGTNANQSCFALGASAGNASEFISRGWGQWGANKSASAAANGAAGSTGLIRTAPYTIGEIIPVFASATSVPSQSNGQSYALTEHMARDVYYLTIASGSGNRIDLQRLGETDVDKFFAHLWLRFEYWKPSDLLTVASAPLLTIQSGANAIPLMQWIATATYASSPTHSLTGSSGQFDMSVGLTIQSGASGVARPSASTQIQSDLTEWFALSIWYDGPANTVWTQVRHRGLPVTLAGTPQLTSGPSGITIDRGSKFSLGSASAPTPGDFTDTVDWPINIATSRVWLEPNITTSLQAASVSDALFQMDTYRPGGFFNDSGTFALPAYFRSEPDSYITLDSDEGLIAVGSGSLITADWQPLLGQPIAIGDVVPGVSSPEKVGGNPDSAQPLERGGPPSPRHYYLYHSCDGNSYQFVQRTRLYSRGVGANDEQVEWLEE